MSITVPIALYGWIPVVLLLFALMNPRRAVIAAFLFAWLFLPMASFTFEGMPNITKTTVTVYAVLLGVAFFDPERLFRFRASWVDLPMLVWVLVPIASSVTAGHGLYDGLSGTLNQAITWGAPYFIGRLYFSTLEGLRELAIGVFIGGLIYAPLCLYEIRMSPQLHTMVYGYHQHVFGQSKRFDGWRPTVFMQHGIAVGMWMTASSLVGVWLWRTRAMTHLRHCPMSLLTPALLIATFMCKSVGALILLVAGLSALFFSKWTKSAAIVLALMMTIPAYLFVRGPLGWDGTEVVSFVSEIDRGRGGSLGMRMFNEHRLLNRAMQRPIFGWGGWGQFRIIEDDEDAKVVTDSLWIISLGRHGIVGLLAMTIAILLPVVLLLRRTRMRGWHLPHLAPAAALAMVLLLFMLDSLFNTMLNPIYLLAGGGLSSLSLSRTPLLPLKGAAT